MTVTTDFGIKLWKQGGEDTQDPVTCQLLMDADTLIAFGRLVWSRIDTGWATNSAYAKSNPNNVRCWGKAKQTVDNRTTNTVGNPGTAGLVPVEVSQGIFLAQSDGTVVAGTLGMSLYLVSDESSLNNSLLTIGIASTDGAATHRPLVGFSVPPTIYPNVNPDPLKIPVRAGQVPFVGPIPGLAQARYSNDPKVYTGAFAVAPGYMYKINPSGATYAFTFPAITSKIDGMAIAVVNVSTGSTATVAAPTGSDNIGNSAGTATGATAAGPTGGAVIVYTADATQLAWLVGI